MNPVKRILCLAILMLGTSLYTNAQSKTSSLLWEISGNGLQQASYLFGTFHILCKEDFQVAGILKDKISNAGQFYGELPMDDMNMQIQLAMKMLMPGKTIQSLMTAADYQKVSDSFQTIVGMPLMTFNHFKPFIALSLLAIHSVPCTENVQPEALFVSIAKEKNIPVLGLETIDDQINVIDKEPLDSQIISLRQTVLNFDSVKLDMIKMIAVYKQRNIDSLYELMQKMGAGGDFETALIVNRNRNWVPVIKKAIAEKSSFIAVGAGHLGGPDGLISLLRKQGYRLTPVMY